MIFSTMAISTERFIVVWLAFVGCLSGTVASSPPAFAFWPLNETFELRDIQPHGITGSIGSATGPTYGYGPTGLLGGSVLIGYGPDNDEFVYFNNSALLNPNGSSFTISLFFNSMGVVGPIFEFVHAFYWDYIDLHFWNAQLPNFLYANDRLVFPQLKQYPCNMSTWQFVALTYDNLTKTVSLFCNNDTAGNIKIGRDPTMSTGHFTIGKRPLWDVRKSCAACLRFDMIALTVDQLRQVRSDCLGGRQVNSGDCKESVRIPLEGLVGYWPLDRRNGLMDLSGNNLHGIWIAPANSKIMQNFTTGPGGAPDSALVTTDSYAHFGYPQLKLSSSSWTIAMYYNFQFSYENPILEYESLTSSWALHIWVNHPSRDFLYFLAAPNYRQSNPCRLLGWQFVAISFDSAAKAYTFFCNQTQTGDPFVTSAVAVTSSGKFNIGKRIGQTPGPSYAAYLSIHRRVLSSETLLQLKGVCSSSTVPVMKRTTTTITPSIREDSLVGYWPLDVSNGLNDLSGNGLHGIWTGAGVPNFTNGPSGNANSALVTSAADGYAHFDGKMLLQLHSSSWTIALFYYSQNISKPTPILEYEKPNSFALHIWANWPVSNLLYLSEKLGASYDKVCPMAGWQFVAITYKSTNASYSLYCNEDQVVFQGGEVADTSSGRFDLGKRIWEPAPLSYASCLSIYRKALSNEELLQLRQQCLTERTTSPPATSTKIVTTIRALETSTIAKEITSFQEFPKLPEAKCFTETKASVIVNECKDVSPLNRSPPPSNQGEPIQAFQKFSIDRLVGIDDVEQTISVTGQLYTKWSVSTCSSMANDKSAESERIVVSAVDEIWHPAIMFRNSVDDILMKNAQFNDRMEIAVDKGNSETHKRDMRFYWKKRGIFSASCKMDLEKFPFDTQNCSFEFAMMEPGNLVQSQNPEIAIVPLETGQQMSTSQQWKILKGWATSIFVEGSNQRDGFFSSTIFTLSIKRRPDYFLFNLLGPCYVIILLAFSTFFIPPQCSDRVCFNVYLLLALIIILCQVENKIPKTSQNILLYIYIEALGLVCLFITFHSITMLWLVSQKSNNSSGKLWLNISGLLIATGLFIAATIYAATVVNLI